MDAFDRLVLVNRANPPPPLTLALPLVPALDRNWCEVMSRSVLANGKWTVMEATTGLADHLPDQSGLYLFIWRIPFPMPTQRDPSMHFRTVLYVGQAGAQHDTGTLKKRYATEYAAIINDSPNSIWSSDMSSRASRLSKLLSLRHLEYWYTVTPAREHLLLYEDALISLFNPPGNTNSSPLSGAELKPVKAKMRPPVPAF